MMVLVPTYRKATAMTVQELAAQPWANVPKHVRHVMQDGTRAVFGWDREGRGTVLVPWTGPKG